MIKLKLTRQISELAAQIHRTVIAIDAVDTKAWPQVLRVSLASFRVACDHTRGWLLPKPRSGKTQALSTPEPKHGRQI